MYLKGIYDASNVPGFALGSTMMGFSIIAKEAGFNFWMVMLTTATVWGMPGQVAFAGLYAVGASLFLSCKINFKSSENNMTFEYNLDDESYYKNRLGLIVLESDETIEQEFRYIIDLSLIHISEPTRQAEIWFSGLWV